MRPKGGRGEVSVQMTASDLISLAVNVANGWSLDDLGYGFDKSEAVQAMLADVNQQVIESPPPTMMPIANAASTSQRTLTALTTLITRYNAPLPPDV